MKKNMFSGIFDKMVANFVPQEDTEARLSVQGVVLVRTNTPNGKEWVDENGTIYPEEYISDFPVFTIAKPVDQVKVGDIVKVTKSTFATVTSTEAGKVETLTFGGEHRRAKAFKDLFLGQATVRVVVNPLAGVDQGNMGNTLMLLSFLDKDSDDKNDLMKTMMLTSMLTGAGQNPLGDLTKNPMTLMMLMKGDGGSVQDILMMQAMQGGLGNMFGAPAPAVAPAAAAAQA